MDSQWSYLCLSIGQDNKEKPLLAKTHYFQGPLKNQLIIPLDLGGTCFGDYEVSLTLNGETLIDKDIWNDHFSFEEVPSITHRYDGDHPSSRDHLIEIEFRVALSWEWPCGAPSSDDNHPCIDQDCPYSGKNGLECAFPHLKTLSIKEVGRKVKRRDDFPEKNCVKMVLPKEENINPGKPITTLFHDTITNRIHWVTYEPTQDSDEYEVFCHLEDVHIKSEKTRERTSEKDLKWLQDLSRQITMEERWVDTDVWPGGNYAFWLHDDVCCKPGSKKIVCAIPRTEKMF